MDHYESITGNRLKHVGIIRRIVFHTEEERKKGRKKERKKERKKGRMRGRKETKLGKEGSRLCTDKLFIYLIDSVLLT